MKLGVEKDGTQQKLMVQASGLHQEHEACVQNKISLCCSKNGSESASVSSSVRWTRTKTSMKTRCIGGRR